MKLTKTTKLKFRRRILGKTDYRRRTKLLQSGLPRLVVRKSLNYIQAQLVEYGENGDRTILSANSRSLKKIGWNFSCNNIPAAYLTGLALGKTAVEKNITQAVLDSGPYKSTKGNRVYAVLKGAVDAGLKIPIEENVIPNEERVSGKHIAEHDQKFKDIPTKFEEIKQMILKVKGG